MSSDLFDSAASPASVSDDSTSDSTTPIDDKLAIRISIPVSIILEHRTITRAFWSVPSWYLHAVGVGDNLSIREGANGEGMSNGEGKAVGTTKNGELFAWTDLEVTLYKDACERYWHALIGDNPLVYVICRDNPDRQDGDDSNVPAQQPAAVTIDYDDASAAAETDVLVLSAPIPGELYKYMEHFVLTHYQPQEFKKRKRRNWSGADAGGNNTSASGEQVAGNEGQGRE